MGERDRGEQPNQNPSGEPISGLGFLDSAFALMSVKAPRRDLDTITDAFLEAQDNPSSPVITKTLQSLGIELETPAERFYALFYITSMATISTYLIISLDETVGEERKKDAKDAIIKISDEFLATQNELLDPSRPRQVLKGEQFRGLHLDRQAMMQVPHQAERGYSKTLLARRNEEEYSLDDGHTAIPAMSIDQMVGLSQAIWELTDNMSDAVGRLDLNPPIDRFINRHNLPEQDFSHLSQLMPTSLLAFKEKTLTVDWDEEVGKELHDKVLIPHQVSQFLSDLGLVFENPVDIIYALDYINYMTTIQHEKNLRVPQSKKEESIKRVRERFAMIEAGSFEMAPFLYTRHRMTQIRSLVEDAFAKNSLAAVKGEVEEFDQIKEQIKRAFQRMRDDMRIPFTTRRGIRINRYLQTVGEMGSKVSSEASKVLMGDFIIIGKLLFDKKVPELIKLYSIRQRDQSLPATLEQFLGIIDRGDTPRWSFEQAGITANEVLAFKKLYQEKILDEDESARGPITNTLYLFIELLDNMRRAGADFTKTGTRGPLFDDLIKEGFSEEEARFASMGRSIYTVLRAYTSPEIVQALISYSGLSTSSPPALQGVIVNLFKDSNS